jgi:hypothetical protein
MAARLMVVAHISTGDLRFPPDDYKPAGCERLRKLLVADAEIDWANVRANMMTGGLELHVGTRNADTPADGGQRLLEATRRALRANNFDRFAPTALQLAAQPRWRR